MKKFLSFLTIISIVFSAVIVPVSAENENVSVKLVSSATEIKPGDTFTITLNVPVSAEFMSGTFDIIYDNSKVEIKSGAINTAAYGGMVTINHTPISAQIIVNSNGGVCGTQDLLATLTFVVNEDATGDIKFDVGYDLDGGIYVYDSTDALTSSKFVTMESFTTSGTTVKINAFTTNTTYEVGSNTTVFKIAITDCPDSGIIYATIFDGKILKACGKKEFTSPVTSETITVDNVTGDTIQVFVWDENGVPLLETPEIKDFD